MSRLSYSLELLDAGVVFTSTTVNRRILHRTLVTKIAATILFSAAQVSAQRSPGNRVNVRLVTDEAEGVLAILAKRKATLEITDTDWQRVFSSEGYVRLKKRE